MWAVSAQLRVHEFAFIQTPMLPQLLGSVTTGDTRVLMSSKEKKKSKKKVTDDPSNFSFPLSMDDICPMLMHQGRQRR